ncbi:Protein translocase subunit SecY [subsurface metagenome]
MWDKIQNIFRIPELRHRILFTLAMFLVFRVGSFIPIPGVDVGALARTPIFQTGAFGLMNIFAGGALQRMSIFALGIMPYISASIIMQLLTVAIPRLEQLSRQGEEGRRKITQYARFAALPIASVQGVALTVWIQSMEGGAFVSSQGIGFILPAVITMTTGTIFIMWLGEKITEMGIGNGISMIIFAGIVAQIRPAIGNVIKINPNRTANSLYAFAFCHHCGFCYRIRGAHLPGRKKSSYSLCPKDCGKESLRGPEHLSSYTYRRSGSDCYNLCHICPPASQYSGPVYSPSHYSGNCPLAKPWCSALLCIVCPGGDLLYLLLYGSGL